MPKALPLQQIDGEGLPNKMSTIQIELGGFQCMHENS